MYGSQQRSQGDLPRHAGQREVAVKAVRLHTYDERPRVEDVAEPTVGEPYDVVV